MQGYTVYSYPKNLTKDQFNPFQNDLPPNDLLKLGQGLLGWWLMNLA